VVGRPPAASATARTSMELGLQASLTLTSLRVTGLVIRPTVPIGAVESLAYALQKGACHCLELDASDLGVSWRKLRSSGREIVLYEPARRAARVS